MKRCLRFVLALQVLLHLAMPAWAREKHPLTLDDVFQLSSLYSASVSPDGEWIAAVVIRPVGDNGVYGRTFYELDPARADVWLISRRTGERRNLTQGSRDASGSWCATWSPDGRRLAMLSTKPEGREPRGGDNVRLYVWDRERRQSTRLTTRGMMVQTLGGAAPYKVDLRQWQGGTGDTAQCGNRDNAPFVWLDNDTLLAVALEQGRVAGLIDAYERGLKHSGDTLARLREGKEPTVTAVESGGAMPEPMMVSLQRIDVAGARARDIATIPTYPLEGVLQISLAPNGRSAALLTSLGAIPPTAGKSYALPFGSWIMDRKLGIVGLAPGSSVRWLEAMPKDGRYILDMMSWTDDGSAIAVRARPDAVTNAQNLYAVSIADLSVARFNAEGTSVSVSASDADVGANFTVMWTHDGRLLARARDAASTGDGARPPRADWWLFARDAAPVNLTSGTKNPPAKLWPAGGRRYIGIVDDALWSLDIDGGKSRQLTSDPLPGGAQIMWPQAQRETNSRLLLESRGPEGRRSLMQVTLQEQTASVKPLTLPSPTAELETYAPEHSLALFRDLAPEATYLWLTDASGAAKKVLTLNEHLANVATSRKMLIDYRGSDGQPLKGGVILPPDYQDGRKYPVVVWVYAGAMINDVEDSVFDVYQAGEYNLNLYAARGYVVLMPSMPLRPRKESHDDYIDVPKGVLPAVDRLVELGIADPQRLAVMGQSYGGYSVYSLVTYTNRFKAAIAMAGLTDLVSLYGQFDSTARSYGSVDHQKSVNWALLEAGQASIGAPPWVDLWRYLRNSPLYFVDRVQTPLLLIHGEQDIRGPMTQAEEFFYALYRQGKRARLLRYWGESHGLRQSPANVRSIISEIFNWLETNMPEKPAPESAPST